MSVAVGILTLIASTIEKLNRRRTRLLGNKEKLAISIIEFREVHSNSFSLRRD